MLMLELKWSAKETELLQASGRSALGLRVFCVWFRDLWYSVVVHSSQLL